VDEPLSAPWNSDDPLELVLSFRHLAENVPGALFQYVQYDDGRNSVLYMSPRCVDLWELGPETIASDSSVLWAMVHDEDRPRMIESVLESARTMGPWFFEWRITTPSGVLKWLQGAGRPVVRGDGWVKWNSFILDITEQRRAQALARELEAKLRVAEQLEAIGRLAGGIAHDVNNVLTAVVGFSESALDETPPDSPARDDLAEVLRAAARGGALTRKLLSFARRSPGETTVFDPVERVEELVVLYQRLFGPQYSVEVQVADRVPPVRFDTVHFDQVLSNLLLNARDAMPGGGKIDVGVRGDGGWLELEVRDEGSGMDEFTRQRIFEPFFTTKGESRGTGLGLSTVHGIVLGVGGEIQVSSVEGEGSSFVVRMPDSIDSSDAGSLPSAIEGTAGASWMPARVLLCDDDAQLLRLQRRVLERAGVQVRATSAPEAAMQALAGFVPDVLVTEVVTGGGGGVALARRLRSLLPHLPVVLTAAYVADELLQFDDLGALAPVILRKPFRPSELLSAIAQARRRSAP
jgi:signal transduction histidine kinase/CheY-like chemotaxis protein